MTIRPIFVLMMQPGNDNSAIKLNIIEQTNIQLIKSEEADSFRLE